MSSQQRQQKTQYCSLKCSSRAYKAKTRKSKIEESNKQTEIARHPLPEAVKTKDFLSVNQASTLFGISRRTIYRIISRGELDIAKFEARTVDHFKLIPSTALNTRLT
jgi:excisionase family DNA binding protein